MITTTKNWSTTVQGINVNISYTFTDSTPPSQMSVYSNWSGNGQSSNINRSYTSDGNFTPDAEHEIYPYTAEFDVAMADLIVDAFINYVQPEV